jgi:hypothetical protein
MYYLEFTKSIINLTKLEEELIQLNNKYVSLYAKGNNLQLKFSSSLTQEEVNAVSSLLNNFVEISILEETAAVLYRKQYAGFALYQRIVSKINIDSNLYTSVDGGLAVYPNFLQIRNLLKDGFFEFALRYLVKDPGIQAAFSVDQLNLFKQWIRAEAKSFGATDELLDAIETLENI